MVARKYITLVMMLLSMLSVSAATTAQSVLDKALAQFNSAKGVSASYTFSSKHTGKQTGTIKMQGKKFCIINPVISTWYDGKNQWNINHDSGEVTLSVPDSQELQMVNPYSFIASYKQYNVSMPKSKIKNAHCLVLTPKSKNSMIRKVVLYINTKDYRPMRADIIDDSGQTSTIIITNCKTGQNFAASEFVFPKAKFPKVKVIDLR